MTTRTAGASTTPSFFRSGAPLACLNTLSETKPTWAALAAAAASSRAIMSTPTPGVTSETTTTRCRRSAFATASGRPCVAIRTGLGGVRNRERRSLLVLALLLLAKDEHPASDHEDEEQAEQGGQTELLGTQSRVHAASSPPIGNAGRWLTLESGIERERGFPRPLRGVKRSSEER